MNIKRLTSIVLTSGLLFGSVNLSSAPVQAAEKNTWAKAYVSILNKMDAADKNNKNITYDLIYVDKDDIPELVISQDYYWVSLYTFCNGKAKAVLQNASYGAMGNAGYYYIKKKNVIYNSNSDYAGMEYYYFYGKISKGKLKNRNKKELCEKYYTDRNKNGMPDTDEYVSNPFYYYGKKQVSKTTFEKYTINGKKVLIKGKVSYDDIVKKLKKKTSSKDSISASLVKKWKGTYKCKDKVIKITKVTQNGISGTRKQQYDNPEGGYYTKSFTIPFVNGKKTVAREEWYEGSGANGLYDDYKLGNGKITIVHPRGGGANEVYVKK